MLFGVHVWLVCLLAPYFEFSRGDFETDGFLRIHPVLRSRLSRVQSSDSSYRILHFLKKSSVSTDHIPNTFGAGGAEEKNKKYMHWRDSNPLPPGKKVVFLL